MEESDKTRLLHEWAAALPSGEQIDQALKELPENEAQVLEGRSQELLQRLDRLDASLTALREEMDYLGQELDDLRDAKQRVQEKSRIARNLEVHGTSPELESEKQALELLRKYYDSKREDSAARFAKVDEAIEAITAELVGCWGEMWDVLHQLGFARPQGDEA